MTTIIFLWAILTTPTDRYICDLWTNIITRDGVIAACGVDLLEGLRLDIYNLDMSPVCSVDAPYLNDLAELAEICQLRHTLDQYVLRIVQPGYNTIICYVETTSQTEPTPEEITAQCPQSGKVYDVHFAGTREDKPEEVFTCPPRVIQTGFGLYQQPPDVIDLITSDDLMLLAGKLLWGGVVKSACPGNGYNPSSLIATPCGMTAARERVIKWQNQFDAEIFDAATLHSVPPKLLKQIIKTESQFYPFFQAADGEQTIMHITDNGLDTLMRFDGADIDPYYFERGDVGQLWSRAVTRDALACHGCTLMEAVEKIKQDLPTYARILAAFHCRATTINPALLNYGDDAWRQTVVDYNGSAEYLERIER